MSQTKLTVEEVMLRIKEAMKADKLSQKSIEYVHEGILVGNDNNSIQNQLRMLDLEIEKNNLKWNVVTEWLITSHRKTIGRFIVFGKKAVRKILRWYINPLFDQQREFNGSVTRSLNIVNELLHNYAGEVKNLNERLDVLQRENNELLQTHADEIRNLNERLDVLQRENNELLQTHADEIRNLNERLDALQREYEKQTEAELIIANDRLRRIERKLNQGLNLDPNTPTINRLVEEDKANHYDFDYFLFEQRFRGSREDIKERQKVYMPYFVGKSNVLDFGCGRGEFVELLLENGVTTQGIDINPDMIAYCQDRGLPVIEADGITYLHSQEDNSLGGLFAAQVIEHLKPYQMIDLIRLAYKKLQPNACILLETINVQALYGYLNYFYMDLSHERPVHPETLKFILEAEGFNNIQILYSSPVEDMAIPPLHINNEDNSEFNRYIDKLNNFLYGPQDYAVIAYK
jgi:2-polyprenyl-3-methyl-5-hydroxy-6-metoxy-1,4-benzoquinol methylase